MRRILAVAAVTAVVYSSAACASEPPPVSEKVQAAYESGRAIAPSVVTPSPNLPVAVFLGDSYTQGTGASVPSKRWTTLVAKSFKWEEANDGRGGTGYLSTADANGCGLSFCPNIESMTDRAIEAAPAVVFVAGGQNDFGPFVENPDAVKASIAATYAKLRKALPKAKIVAVGPSTPWNVDHPVIGLDAAVEKAAKTVGGTYVSLLSPNVIKKEFVLPDGGHVNDAGHQAIAERVISALR